MTTYCMNEDGRILKEPATIEDLSSWANAYHQKYFGQRPAPSITIALSTDPEETGSFVPAINQLRIPEALTAFEKSCRIVMLHEMVHIYLYQENGDPDEHHGTRFKAEVDLLLEEGACMNLL